MCHSSIAHRELSEPRLVTPGPIRMSNCNDDIHQMPIGNINRTDLGLNVLKLSLSINPDNVHLHVLLRSVLPVFALF